MMEIMKVIRDTREGAFISGIPQVTCNQIVYNSAMKNKLLNSQVSVEHNYVPTRYTNPQCNKENIK